jgi:hypothetical protein
MYRCRCSITVSSWLIGTCLAVGPAAGGECGGASPDYTARRSVTIGNATEAMRVYVSGSKMREEHTGPRSSVVIRLPEQHTTYIFNPERNEGVQLTLPPPPAPKLDGRMVVDTRADGTISRRFQLRNETGEWTDVSTTICRADGVMLEQRFGVPDGHGNIIDSRLSQSEIVVGTIAASLFVVPPMVVMQTLQRELPRP